MMNVRTYTIPRIGLDDNINGRYNSNSVPRGTIKSPLEVKANATNFSLTVQGMNKCIHTQYETTKLYYTRYLHNESSTPYTYTNTGTSLGETNIGDVNSKLVNTGYEHLQKLNDSPSVSRVIKIYNYIYSMNNAQLKNLIPEKYDGDAIRFMFYMKSVTTANVDLYNTTDFNEYNKLDYCVTVYYRPRLAVNHSTIQLYENSNSGKSIEKGSFFMYGKDTQNIYVKWSYDTTKPRTGVVNGYRINIYDKDKNVVKTYHTNTSYYTIPLEDLKVTGETFISITPYYISNSGDYWYQQIEENTISPFVRLICRLQKPIITYPVNNSNWINDKFRICFTLPEDLDRDYIEQDLAVSQGVSNEETNLYRYANIELYVNGKIYAIKETNLLSNNCIIKPEIFSCLPDNMEYKRNIIICPFINETNISNSYSIKVRVKKNYGIVDHEYSWSDWSDVVNITMTPINYSVNKGDYVLASHFNTALNDVDRTRKTYGVKWDDKQSNAIKNSTIIKANQYSWENMFSKTYETKMTVNNYGLFDNGRSNLKFDIEDKILNLSEVLDTIWIPSDKIIVNLPQSDEKDLFVLPDIEEDIVHLLPTIIDNTHYITALKDDELLITENTEVANVVRTVLKPGKNYIQYVEDNCNNLK